VQPRCASTSPHRAISGCDSGATQASASKPLRCRHAHLTKPRHAGCRSRRNDPPRAPPSRPDAGPSSCRPRNHDRASNCKCRCPARSTCEAGWPLCRSSVSRATADAQRCSTAQHSPHGGAAASQSRSAAPALVGPAIPAPPRIPLCCPSSRGRRAARAEVGTSAPLIDGHHRGSRRLAEWQASGPVLPPSQPTDGPNIAGKSQRRVATITADTLCAATAHGAQRTHAAGSPLCAN